MSLYRKIHLEIHADEKFRSLSKPQPNAQTLWFFLLTGPHTTAIPGLSTVGEAAMAEMLEWPIEDFRCVFAEIESKGMVKADWKNRVVWIPKGIYYNQPESPNVVKSWGKQWGLIPECPLKKEARQAIINLLVEQKFGPAFKKVFKDAFKVELPEGRSKDGESTFAEPSGKVETAVPPSSPPDGFSPLIPLSSLSPSSSPSLYIAEEKQGAGDAGDDSPLGFQEALQAFDRWCYVSERRNLRTLNNEHKPIRELVTSLNQGPPVLRNNGREAVPAGTMVAAAVENCITSEKPYKTVKYAISIIRNIIDEWTRKGMPPPDSSPADRSKPGAPTGNSLDRKLYGSTTNQKLNSTGYNPVLRRAN